MRSACCFVLVPGLDHRFPGRSSPFISAARIKAPISATLKESSARIRPFVSGFIRLPEPFAFRYSRSIGLFSHKDGVPVIGI